MRAEEFIIERINATWIRPWVARSVPGKMPTSGHTEWYSSFFKNLESDEEYRKWIKTNVSGPLVLKPRLLSDPYHELSVLNAEHLTYHRPIEHEIIIEINVLPTIDDQKKLDAFVDRLAARLTHELNHAQQVSVQFKATRKKSQVFKREHHIFKGTPPVPKNDTEKYFQYLLNNLERDAWVSEIAQDIKHKLGADSAKFLPVILNQAKNEDYALAGNKIVQIPALHTLYKAIQFYRGQLRYSGDELWRKLQTELYKYITQK